MLGALGVLALTPGSAGAVVLYDQYDNEAIDGVVSAARSDDPTLSAQAADDFVVPAGQTWNITSIDVRGWSFFGSSDRFNVFFYANGAGDLPGTELASRPNSTSAGTEPTLSIALASPVTLGPGTYWVSPQSNMSGDNWYWGMRTVQSNNGAAFKEVGGYGTGCLIWSRRGLCTATESSPDQIFRLHGTEGVQRTLTVNKAGSGSGTVTSNPAGINCGADCVEAYDEGSAVTLTATPAAGSRFAGWSGGGCSGTGTCQVTMDAAKTVTATFAAERTLTVGLAGTGTGVVTSSPAGIHCGSDCIEAYLDGTSLSLTATPAAGSTFVGFTGACSGAACGLTMDADKGVAATFNLSGGGGGGGGGGAGPLETSITKQKIKAGAGKAKFRFTGSGGTGALSFECKLDKKPYKPCTSPAKYKKLDSGKHKFRVRTKDSTGAVDATPAKAKFKID